MAAVGVSERLTGVWSLHSLRRFRDAAFYRYPMGAAATGRIIYSPTGYMGAFLMSEEWRQGKVQGQSIGSSKDFLSYSGRWRLSDSQTVVHEVDAASVFEFIGRTLERRLSFTPEGYLLLRTETHTIPSGAKSHDELIWVRVAPWSGGP